MTTINTPRIDSHIHLWDYHKNVSDFTWMNDKMNILRKDFTPNELAEELAKSNYHGAIAVQARQSLEETKFLLNYADTHPNVIIGVVGWFDLRASPTELAATLESMKHSKLVGVRHIAEDEPDDNFLCHPDVAKGIQVCHEAGLAYDLLCRPRHLPAAITLVRSQPNTRFVLDHIAKPEIGTKGIQALDSPWTDNIRTLASYPNVYCKLSGMITEAVWEKWTREEFIPFMKIVLEAFGSQRLMLGSDWPVCKLSGEHSEAMDVAESFLRSHVSQQEYEDICGRNALKFYRLSL